MGIGMGIGMGMGIDILEAVAKCLIRLLEPYNNSTLN